MSNKLVTLVKEKMLKIRLFVASFVIEKDIKRPENWRKT